MNDHLHKILIQATGASHINKLETIQSLWSGYGSIDRYQLDGCQHQSVVVKHVRIPNQADHPRGWNTDRSHQRKITSYEVEATWYEDYASRCDDFCRIPRCLAVEHKDGEVLMVLEDLNDSGFAILKSHVNTAEIQACLEWLANFHACFMGMRPSGLWNVGTYWHLATRPDEWHEMEKGKLKQAAKYIDTLLTQAPFSTLVHGDAKLANFCFSADKPAVAAVDFQYVGGGCGIKDIAYFIGSCLDEKDCAMREEELLDVYFNALKTALPRYHPEIEASAVESVWRPLYPVAWTDFHRFLLGWSPDHWKINSYSDRLAAQVLKQLELIS